MTALPAVQRVIVAARRSRASRSAASVVLVRFGERCMA
jgi:hypothetical protein